MKQIISLIILSFVLTGCPQNKLRQNSNDFVILYKGTLHGAGEEGFKEENRIINSEKEWKDFLLKLDSTNKISDAFGGEINFSENSVIAVFDSVKTTGGYSIMVSRLEVKNDELIVYIEKTGPKPTDMVTMVIEQPFHIIKIGKTAREIVFKK